MSSFLYTGKYGRQCADTCKKRLHCDVLIVKGRRNCYTLLYKAKDGANDKKDQAGYGKNI